ncbi:PAB-dependent poly(A)-specific ribonuclease subunit PAN2 [Fusarium austroafricanum]|uniref:PAB-dependent poly(A)-specific ribonuclease subunit PAN2 n=1 Tax=Fusarium austroafricanum TaxID=2364996 RepID=A0A8H4KL84_9HYPO|nr:PAB-dependent poly(A)-specific ribonuclease subunit PAN2 [Fusarium austroafricanum]
MRTSTPAINGTSVCQEDHGNRLLAQLSGNAKSVAPVVKSNIPHQSKRRSLEAKARSMILNRRKTTVSRMMAAVEGNLTHPIHLQLTYPANKAPVTGPASVPMVMTRAMMPRYIGRSLSMVMSDKMAAGNHDTRIPFPSPGEHAMATPVTAMALDDSQELLWTGNNYVCRAPWIQTRNWTATYWDFRVKSLPSTVLSCPCNTQHIHTSHLSTAIADSTVPNPDTPGTCPSTGPTASTQSREHDKLMTSPA